MRLLRPDFLNLTLRFFSEAESLAVNPLNSYKFLTVNSSITID